MLTSFPIENTYITHVHRVDVVARSRIRVVRTLLQHLDTKFIVTVHQTEDQIQGLILSPETMQIEDWVLLDKPVLWVKGSVPISVADQNPLFTFWTKEQVQDNHFAEMRKAIEQSRDESIPLLERVAHLELINGLLGDQPQILQALLSLAEKHPGSLEIGSKDLLHSRWRRTQ